MTPASGAGGRYKSGDIWLMAVAMGRAIVRSPQVFLMDEPLSNLDAKLRVQMRSEIIRIQKQLGTTMVYVTHDQVEAMTMGHRVAVMRLGVLQQVAAPQELYQRPGNVFVAAFIGSPAMNLINATLGGTEQQPTVSFVDHTIAIDPRAIDRYPQIVDHIGSPVVLGLRPEHFVMAGDADLPDDQCVEFEVDLAEAMGAEVHLHTTLDVPIVEVGGAPVSEDADIEPTTTQVIARVDGIHVVESGTTAKFGVKTHLAHFFDPATGQPLS